MVSSLHFNVSWHVFSETPWNALVLAPAPQGLQAGIVSQTMMKYLMEVSVDYPNLEYFIFSYLKDTLKIGISNIFHIVEVNIFNGIV